MPRWGDNPVTFDEFDTLLSAMSKLDGSPDDAPVVIIAPGCYVANNTLLYRLLSRSSERMSAPIAVVSQNPLWRKLAREHGLSAFPSMGSVRRSRRRSALSLSESFADSIYSSLLPSLAGHGRLFVATFIVLLAVVMGAGYMILPVMTVTLETPVENFTADVRLRVDASVTSPDRSSGIIPGRMIQHRFTTSDFIEVTGSKTVGKDRAAGEATVINSSTASIDLPRGTVLVAASGQKYETTAPVRVGAFSRAPGPTPSPAPSPTPSPAPAGRATPAPVPQVSGVIVRVPIQAVDPGKVGNVPALAIARFESTALSGLTVFNEQPLVGGNDSTANVVSEADRNRLKESLFQRAQAQALSELQVRVRGSESLVPHSMQVSIEREEYDREIGDETKQLRGSVNVFAAVVAFANPDLNAFAQSAWETAVPQGYGPITGDFQIAPPEITNATPRSADLRVRVTGKVERALESGGLVESLRGLTEREASDRLAQMKLPLKTVDIALWPDWAIRAYRVEIKSKR
jgi:hypothetical protein